MKGGGEEKKSLVSLKGGMQAVGTVNSSLTLQSYASPRANASEGCTREKADRIHRIAGLRGKKGRGSTSKFKIIKTGRRES